MNKDQKLKVGSIVQIAPASDQRYGGCYMFVTEPKGFGAQGYLLSYELPKGLTTYKGKAYVRISFENMEYIGESQWISKEDLEREEE